MLSVTWLKVITTISRTLETYQVLGALHVINLLNSNNSPLRRIDSLFLCYRWDLEVFSELPPVLLLGRGRAGIWTQTGAVGGPEHLALCCMYPAPAARPFTNCTVCDAFLSDTVIALSCSVTALCLSSKVISSERSSKKISGDHLLCVWGAVFPHTTNSDTVYSPPGERTFDSAVHKTALCMNGHKPRLGWRFPQPPPWVWFIY